MEGLHDFAFGATFQLGKQFSYRLWVGFGLDLGASALRIASLNNYKNVSTQFDAGVHLYTAPRAQVIYMFVHGKTRMGVQASLAIPVLMANVDYTFTRDNTATMREDFEVWSGLYLNLELLLGVR